ncbi:MAG: hypothetical protein ACREBN_00345 [Burkholderiaceae bacterium]
MRLFPRFAALLLMTAMVTSIGAQELVESYFEARAQARLDELDETTKGYHRDVLLPDFQQRYGRHFRECSQQLPSPEPTPFSFVVAIGADGQVRRLWSDRSTSVYQCVRGKLLFDRFGPPPRTPFYLFVQMRFTDPDPREKGNSK